MKKLDFVDIVVIDEAKKNGPGRPSSRFGYANEADGNLKVDNSHRKLVIQPEFNVMVSDDLMTKGRSFYAVWDEDAGSWSKNMNTVCRIVDEALYEYAKSYEMEGIEVKTRYLRKFSSKKWTEFLAYCASMEDNYHDLDMKLTFANDEVRKEDYSSKRLGYSLAPGDYSAWDELIGTLYDPPERQKIEWAIGCIVSGDSVNVQKFMVLYGSAGTGKSTVLNIIQKLFDGYYSMFEAKALASNNNAFALEPFRANPLVSIQHDGDLSRIEDNTKLNSIVSHETMVVNEKRKAQYEMRFSTFIFMGTNKPVTITDSKSGILRRLIDVKPSGRKVDFARYNTLMLEIDNQLGAIADHCLSVYSEMGETAYDQYMPLEMMGETNDFYNFIEDNMFEMTKGDGITLRGAWDFYRKWCEKTNAKYTKTMKQFKSEFKTYFNNYDERKYTSGVVTGAVENIVEINHGGKTSLGEEPSSFLTAVIAEKPQQYRKIYSGLKTERFSYLDSSKDKPVMLEDAYEIISLVKTESSFDKNCGSYPAQYANDDGTPSKRWDNVTTTLADIDTSKLHYVKLPENHIVIDFDLKDREGNKSQTANLLAATKWPRTYAEFSKSGKGVHLHYFYEGDISELSNIYDDDIEIKVFKGNSSLRRKLTYCNDLDISTLNIELPKKKGGKKVIDFEGLRNEKALRTLIERNLKKEIHPGTKPSVDFIFKILDEAYESGMKYDVSDMRPRIMAFANNSTNHSVYCLKLVSQMKFCSDEPGEGVDWEEPESSDEIVFYDVEVFKNLFVIVWKYEGSDTCVQMINPTPEEAEKLCRFKLVGFNNRRYDNHILYGRVIGLSNEQLYEQSQRIIGGGKESRSGYFAEAWNLSYADIYDYSSNKQSLKKWEIELGIHHQELGLPWDEPVPEDLWEKVALYCVNDVRATESVFKATYDDFQARCLLADLSGLRINESTRRHGTRIIFGDDKNAVEKLVYTDLSEMFPGYTFDHGKSMYRGEDPGEGGYVYSEPGYYEDVALLDIASMHPTSLIELNYLGPYTKRFEDLVKARLAIKHGDHDSARKMLDGKLAKYIDDPDISDKKLAYALKIIINSVYGWTAARFPCEFRHPLNDDNIVAKRGALFMINLKHEVQDRGFTVAHIKTDSIKIPNATQEIIDFVTEYGKQYGYTFEHEDTYDRMCLVNQAVYICHSESHYEDHGGWDATGTQFAVPYVFKSLFSEEPIEFRDMCETKTVSVGDIYIDMDENLEEGDHDLHFVGRAGLFTPILPGRGGGTLYRVADDKLYALSGTKGYKWLESETVQLLEKQDDVDVSYYDRLCDEAVKTIEQYVPFDKLKGAN